MNDTAQTEDTNITTVTPRQPKPIDTVRSALEKMQPQFALALPKHITPERMVRVALTAIQNTPKLLDCDRQSLYSAVMRAAQLGLEPDGILGQAYLIPYGKTVQFIPGYKGLIDLARRSGEVSNIIAKEVYKNDEFTVDFSKEIPFVHKPKLHGDRGELTHFWAMARFKDGGFHWDYMTKAEVETIRDQGNGKNNEVWKKHFIEMGKKTAIRRIAKYLPMSVQRAAMTEDLVDAGKQFSTNDFGDIVIEGEAKVIDDDTKKTGSEGVKEKLRKSKAKAAGADPETGEIKDYDANSAEIKTPSPADIEQPMPALETVDDVKQAASVLIIAIEAVPKVLRSGLFIKMHGMAIVEAIRAHGEGLLIGKIKALGIALPEAESEAA